MMRPLGRKERRALAKVQTKQRRRTPLPDDREVPALGEATILGTKRYVFNDALTRQLAAFHEAGHAVVSVATGHPLHATEITSDGSGWTLNRPGDSKVLLNFKKPEDRAYARRIALICLARESAEGSRLASLLEQLALPPGNAPEVLAEAAQADRAQALEIVANLQWEEMRVFILSAGGERCRPP